MNRRCDGRHGRVRGANHDGISWSEGRKKSSLPTEATDSLFTRPPHPRQAFNNRTPQISIAAAIQRPAAELARTLALELGFSDPDDSGPLRWTEPITPGAALRNLLLHDASPDPAMFPAALAAWRTRDPEGVEAVIQTITAAINATLSPPDDPVTTPHS